MRYSQSDSFHNIWLRNYKEINVTLDIDHACENRLLWHQIKIQMLNVSLTLTI